MNRFIKFLLAVGFIHLAYGLIASFWKPEVLPISIGPLPAQIFYDYSGVINVHSKLSSGSGSEDEIIAAAQQAGLDFIALTDSNNFDPDLEKQGYKDNLFVFIGGEYNFLDSRLLNFDLHNKDHLQGPGRSQMIFADILSKPEKTPEAGMFIVAHPLKKGYQLKGEYPPGLDGIEILNLKNIWQDTWLHSKVSFFWTLFVYPFNANLAFIRMLADAFDDELDLLDKLNRTHTVYGFAGSDADAKLKLWGEQYLRFPSYETLFSIARNHVLVRSELTGNVEQDRKRLSDAIRNGQLYTSVDILQNPKGFTSYIAGPRGFIAPLGAKINYRDNLELIVRLPAKPLLPFQILIYKDGEKILTSTSKETTFSLHGPGVYRSVVRIKVPLMAPDGRKWLKWIVTNPIFVQK